MDIFVAQENVGHRGRKEGKIPLEDFQVPSFMLVFLCLVLTQSDSQ